MTEIIRMPYSFFSVDGHQEIVDALEEIGYRVVKTYPEQEAPETEPCCMFCGKTDYLNYTIGKKHVCSDCGSEIKYIARSGW